MVSEETATPEEIQPTWWPKPGPGRFRPLAPFAPWSLSHTPVIPSFYYDVYSPEQRIKQMCESIQTVADYLDYVAKIQNTNNQDFANKLAELSAKLTEEVARLDGLLDEETASREEADEALQEALEAEQAAREAADKLLQENLDAETAARIKADEELQAFIEQVEAAAAEKAADLEDKLNQEIRDRTNGDNDLAQKIQEEAAARELTDTQLTTSLQVETEAREAADEALGTRIDGEATARVAADNALQAAVDAEEEARKNADESIQTALDTETEAREQADQTIVVSVSTETEARKEADDAIIASLNTEVEARKEADDAVLAALNTEVEAREQGDNTLQSNLDNVESSLTTSIRNRPRADRIIAGDGIEVNNSIDTDSDDATTVTISSTVAGDISDLEARLTQEVTDRTSGDSSLQAQITNEISERQDADRTITEALSFKLTGSDVHGESPIVATADPDSTTVTVSFNGEGYATDEELAAVEGKADQAQSTADEAKEAASNAQQAADSAQSTADEAKTVAEQAQSTADEAKTTADEAATNIVTVSETVTSVQEKVTSIETSLDSKLEADNLIAGINITLDKDGNNVTINSGVESVGKYIFIPLNQIIIDYENNSYANNDFGVYENTLYSYWEYTDGESGSKPNNKLGFFSGSSSTVFSSDILSGLPENSALIFKPGIHVKTSDDNNDVYYRWSNGNQTSPEHSMSVTYKNSDSVVTASYSGTVGSVSQRNIDSLWNPMSPSTYGNLNYSKSGHAFRPQAVFFGGGSSAELYFVPFTETVIVYFDIWAYFPVQDATIVDTTELDEQYPGYYLANGYNVTRVMITFDNSNCQHGLLFEVAEVEEVSIVED